MRHYLADLTGSTEVLGTLTASNIMYPSSDGTSNQVIQTDGSGRLSFTSTVDSASHAVSAETASYVESSNIDGDIVASEVSFDSITSRPTLLSSSAQVQYGSISSIPSGIVSSSTQINALNITADSVAFGNVTSLPTLVSSSGQIAIGSTTGTLAVNRGGTGATTAAAARTNLGVDAAGTDNSTDVTLAGTPNYITIVGQVITRNQIDLASDVTGTLPANNVGNLTAAKITDFGTNVVSNLPAGTISSSAQVDTSNILPANTVSSSAQIVTLINNQDVTLDDVTVGGNLTVTGTTTTVQSDNLDVTDKQISVNRGGTTPASANGGGIFISGANASLTWDNGNSRLNVNKPFNVVGNITTTGTVDGIDIAAQDGKLVSLLAATSSFLTGHPNISAASSVDNSGRTYIQDITVDSNGHVTGITSATETVTNTNTFRTVTAGGNTLGASETLAFTAGTNVTITESGGAVTINSTDTNTQLSTEAVQDIVGGMVTGNTESGITVSYQDGDGTLDFSVASQTDQNFTTALKNKLDGIAASANNYSHPTFDGDDINIDTGALTGATVISDLDFNITTNNQGHVTDANASVSTRNLTLANLGYTGATDANNYSLPEATATTRGGIELFSNTDQSVAANSVTSTAGRTYGLQLNSDGQAVVNVPWTDTNTNTQLSTEQVQDIVGAMFTGNTETRISATYQDGDGTIDLVVTDQSYTLPEATATTRGGIELFSNTDQSVAANSVSSTAGRTYGIQLNSAGQAVVNVPWTDTNTDTNTFRTVTAGGNTLGASETLAFTAGTNITITESGGAVTINSTDTNTQLSTEQVQDIVGAMFTGNTETRISATYQDSDGTIDLVATDQSYTLPEATATTRGGIELFSNTDQSVAANSVSSTAGRTYGLQLNSAGQAVVNVPWTDTNTNTNQLTTFQVEDGDGTEVTISHGKEWKFVEGTGININWTDTSSGTNADPYDLTIGLTGDSFDADGTFASLRAQGTTAGDVGLGNVTNESKATMFTSPTFTGTVTAPTPSSVVNNTTVATTAFVKNQGYTTYTANQTLNNTSNVHFEGLMVGQTSGATANTIRCVGDVVAYYSSDRQFKDNIVTLDGALDKVKAIRGVRFDWNDKQDVHEGHDIGVVAQEVEEVLPELVHYREHNDSKAVDYVKLTAVLIEAVKELSAKVEELESKH